VFSLACQPFHDGLYESQIVTAVDLRLCGLHTNFQIFLSTASNLGVKLFKSLEGIVLSRRFCSVFPSEGDRGTTGMIQSKETRRKIGEANKVAQKGKVVPEITRQRIRAATIARGTVPPKDRSLLVAHRSSMRKITRTSRMSDAEFAIFIENSPVSGGGYLGEEFPSNAVADVPYTNLPTPMPSDMATEQTGSFASSVGSYSNRFTQGVNSQAKVFVTGIGVIRNGYTSQSSLQASLAEGSCTLIGNVSDSYNRVTNPATGIYKWVSLNSMIATVSNNGLVHFLRKGQVTIECRYSRQANASYAGSTPSGTEFAYGTCEIQIVN